jgi:hypothetical protein
MARQVNPRSVGKADKDMGQRIRLRRVELKNDATRACRGARSHIPATREIRDWLEPRRCRATEQIAAIMNVPITFFYDSGKAGQKQEKVERLVFLDAPTRLRLLRAYIAIKDQTVKRRFVTLVDSLAGIG